MSGLKPEPEVELEPEVVVAPVVEAGVALPEQAWVLFVAEAPVLLSSLAEEERTA